VEVQSAPTTIYKSENLASTARPSMGQTHVLMWWVTKSHSGCTYNMVHENGFLKFSAKGYTGGTTNGNSHGQANVVDMPTLSDIVFCDVHLIKYVLLYMRGC